MGEPNLVELQALLEGVDLPASKQELLAYARRSGAESTLVGELERLRSDSYSSLDDVAEELRPVQPTAPGLLPDAPRPESGTPPGADEYTSGAS